MNFIDLGQVSALRISSVAPTNRRLLWYDSNITTGPKIKYWEEGSQSWQLLAGSGGGGSNGAPVTFIELSIAPSDKEVILEWNPAITAKHGTRPVSIKLYEIGTGYLTESTAKDYTEDNGETYRWFVNTMSPRRYEIRIFGYTTDALPQIPQPAEDTTITNLTNQNSGTPNIT